MQGKAKYNLTLFCSLLYICAVGAQCPDDVIKNQGSINYYTYGQEKCTWVLGPQNMKTDVVLAIRFLKYSDWLKQKVTETTGTLPNGDALDNEKFFRVRKSTQPWCGLYVKRNSGNEITCKPNIPFLTTCKNHPNTTESNMWPPVMDITATYTEITLGYEVYHCYGNLIFPVSTSAFVTTQPIFTTKETQHSSTSMAIPNETNIHVSSTANKTTLSRQETEVISQSSYNQLVTVTISVGTLLAVALIVTGILAIKLGTKNKNSHNNSTPQENRTRLQINDGANNPHIADGSEREMVDNQIYDCGNETKQTVYNEIYHT